MLNKYLLLLLLLPLVSSAQSIKLDDDLKGDVLKMYVTMNTVYSQKGEWDFVNIEPFFLSIYEYKNGLLKKEKRWGIIDMIDYEVNYQYDGDGRLLSGDIVYENHPKSNDQWKASHPKKGVTRMLSPKTELYFYEDDAGRLLKRTALFYTNGTTQTHLFENGRMADVKLTDSLGNIVLKRHYSAFDEDKKMYRYQSFKSDDSLEDQGWKKYQYDAQGNWVAQLQFVQKTASYILTKRHIQYASKKPTLNPKKIEGIWHSLWGHLILDFDASGQLFGYDFEKAKKIKEQWSLVGTNRLHIGGLYATHLANGTYSYQLSDGALILTDSDGEPHIFLKEIAFLSQKETRIVSLLEDGVLKRDPYKSNYKALEENPIYAGYKKVTEFSTGSAIVTKESGDQAIMDRKIGQLLTTWYDDLFVVTPNLIGAKKGYKYGLLDRQGKEVIPMQYNKFKIIHSNCFLIENDARQQALIDSTNNLLFPFTTGKFKSYRHNILIFRFKKQGGILSPSSSNPPNKRGNLESQFLVDKEGNTLFKHKRYKEIRYGTFDRLLVTDQQGKDGIIDRTGKEILAPQSLELGAGGSHNFSYEGANGKWGLLDKNGIRLTEPIYDKLTFCGDNNRKDKECKYIHGIGVAIFQKGTKTGNLNGMGEEF